MKDWQSLPELHRLQARVKQAFLELRKGNRGHYPYEQHIAHLAGVPQRRVWSLLYGAGIVCRRIEGTHGTCLVERV